MLLQVGRNDLGVNLGQEPLHTFQQRDQEQGEQQAGDGDIQGSEAWRRLDLGLGGGGRQGGRRQADQRPAFRREQIENRRILGRRGLLVRQNDRGARWVWARPE